MKKISITSTKIDSLTDFHKLLGLPKPLHPMISFFDVKDVNILDNSLGNKFILNFYKISYKSNVCSQAKYGQNYYDFGEGGLVYTAPNQIFEVHDNVGSGYVLLIHPDFLLSYPIAKRIKQYGFFFYSTNEALHLSDKERETIFSVFRIIDDELNNRIDDFSQDVIISQLELLLNYSNRFYNRQFITRKAINNDILQNLEDILNNYYDLEESYVKGIPKVQQIAEILNISPSYLSDLLRSLTGQNAQQHIQNKIIEKGKELLSSTNLSVAEISFQLGFEHPQSFSKLFKTKTNQSPLEFRQSFN